MKQGATTTNRAGAPAETLPHTLPKIYLPIDVIASGGMGVVYRVVDRLRGQVVALKQLKAGVSGDRRTLVDEDETRDLAGHDLAAREFIAREFIANEFRTLSTLRHPYILPALDFGFDDDEKPFFTMPLLEHPVTILEYAAGQPFATQVNLLMQVLQALIYLHQHRVLHNDLKPSNILVVDGRVQILDFGLASIVGEIPEDTSGTLRYLAPERLRGASPSPEADFFALGVIAFEIFADPPLLAEALAHYQPTPDDARRLHIDAQTRDVVACLLSTDPAERRLDFPALVRLYTERLGQPLPYAELATQESFLNAAPFVGRKREHDQLSAALGALLGQSADATPVSSGTRRGGCWLMGGESGIGKSRLLEELRVEALVKRIAVVRGQITSDLNRPYGWLEETLRWLRLMVDVDEADEAVFNLVLPESGALHPGQFELPSLDPEDVRRRVLDVVERLLRRNTSPLLVVIEDIHWLSPDGLATLGQLTERAADTVTLFVASYRPEYHPALAEGFPHAHVMNIGRLASSSVRSLVEAMLGRSASDPFLHFMEGETEGNPFFIVEVTRALAEGANGLSNVPVDDVPREVFAVTRDNVLQRRIQSLPEWVRALLPCAAVIGRSVDRALLARLFPDVDLERWLAVCGGWYVLEGDGSGWRFAHDRIRETVLNGLEAAQRRDLHGQVARMIEAISGDDDLAAPVLAYHWKGAEDADKEAHYCVRAGALTVWQSDYSSAVSYLKRALELESAIPRENRALVENLLGEALYGAGFMVEGETHLSRALAAYRIPRTSILSIGGEVLRQGYHRLARTHMRSRVLAGQDQQRIGLIVRACEKLAQINYIRNQRFEAVYYALQGLNQSEYLGVGARAEQARFYGSMALAFGLIAQHRMANFYLRQADSVSRASTDQDALAWTNEVTGTYLAGCGRWDEAEARYRESIRASQQIGNKRRQLEALGFLAALYLNCARWDALAALSTEFERIDPHRDDPQARLWDLITRGMQRLLTGDAEAAFDWASEIETVLARVDDVATRIRALGFLTLYYVQFDLLDVAHNYAASLIDAISKTSPVAFPALDGYMICAAFYLRGLAFQPSPERLSLARRACRALDVFGRAFAIGRPYALIFSGWLALLQGKTGSALRLAEQARLLAVRLTLPTAETAAVALLLGGLAPGDGRQALLKERAAVLRTSTRVQIEILLPTSHSLTTGD